MASEKDMGTKQAADYLGLTTGTLANYRSLGIGPKYTTRARVAGEPGRARVFYRRQDLDRWVKSMTCPTCGRSKLK